MLVLTKDLAGILARPHASRADHLPRTARYAAVVGRGPAGCGGRLPIGVTLLGVGVGRFEWTSWSSSWYAERCSSWQLATDLTSRFSSSASASTCGPWDARVSPVHGIPRQRRTGRQPLSAWSKRHMRARLLHLRVDVVVYSVACLLALRLHLSKRRLALGRLRPHHLR